MASVNKVFKNSSLYTLCAFLQKGSGFLLLPVYTSYLSPEDYGVMNLIVSITGFLSIFFLCSLHGAASRFHFRYNSSKKQSVVWGTILLLVLFNSFFLGGISIIFHKILIDPFTVGIPFFPLVFLALIGTMLSPLYLFYQSWLQCHQEGEKYAKNLLSNFILQTALNLILLILFHKGVFGMIFSSFLVSTIFFIYSIIKFVPHISLHIDKQIAFSAIKYSLPLVPHSVSGYLSVMLDRILLNNLVNAHQVGLYSVASQFGSILYIITSSINQAFTPWLYQVLEERPNQSDLQPIYKFAEISNVCCSFIALSITILSPELIMLMTAHDFLSSWDPIIYISFGYVFNGLYFFYSNTLFLSHTKYIMLISISSAVANFVLNLCLIPYWGYCGAGLAFLISQVLSSVIAMILSRRLVPLVAYNWWRMYFTCFLFFMLGASVFLFQMLDSTAIRLALKTFLIIIVMGIVTYLYKDSIYSFINRIFKIKR